MLSGQCTLSMVSLRNVREERRHARATTAFASTARSRTRTSRRSATATATRRASRSRAATEAVRYFMSAGRDDEVGVFKLDHYEQNRYRLARHHDPSVADASEHAPAEQLPRQHQRAGQSAVRRGGELRLQHGRTRSRATNRTTRSASARRRSAARATGTTVLISGIAGLARRLSRRHAGLHLGGEAPAEREPHDPQRRT